LVCLLSVWDSGNENARRDFVEIHLIVGMKEILLNPEKTVIAEEKFDQEVP